MADTPPLSPITPMTRRIQEFNHAADKWRGRKLRFLKIAACFAVIAVLSWLSAYLIKDFNSATIKMGHTVCLDAMCGTATIASIAGGLYSRISTKLQRLTCAKVLRLNDYK